MPPRPSLPPALVLTRGAQESLAAAVRTAAEREACGLLLGLRSASIWRVEELTRERNLALGHNRGAFALDPASIVPHTECVAAPGAALLGTWHSHPGGRAALSAADRAATWNGACLLVVAVRGSALVTASWVLADERFARQEIRLQGWLSMSRASPSPPGAPSLP